MVRLLLSSVVLLLAPLLHRCNRDYSRRFPAYTNQQLLVLHLSRMFISLSITVYRKLLLKGISLYSKSTLNVLRSAGLVSNHNTYAKPTSSQTTT
jgi:hypothetical protein